MAGFLVGLLDEVATKVTVDSAGLILLGEPGARSVADDHFADARAAVDAAIDAEISALYELGVTKGAGAAAVQNPDEAPLDFNYEPDSTVTRGQMAAFITRALAHSAVRPAGVSAQYDGVDVIVSVRNARFEPVPRAVVDVFWTTADRAGAAVSADGSCAATVTGADASSMPCEIDDTDPVTGADGDARVAVTGLRRVPRGGAVVWAWTGRLDDKAQPVAGLYRLDIAEGADLGLATVTLLTTSFDSRRVRFGQSVVYGVQLRDVVGDVSTGTNGTDAARWRLEVRHPGEDPEVRTLVSDSGGAAGFTISAEDPNPTGDNPSHEVRYTLTPLDNAPPSASTVNAAGAAAATGTVIFSDSTPSIAPGDATAIIDTRPYVHVLDRSAATSVTVTVLDQYGSPLPGTRVNLTGGTPTVCTVNNRGSCRFTLPYGGDADGQAQTLAVGYGLTSPSTGSASATLYWAVDAGPTSDSEAPSVVAGDVRRRQIVAQDGTGIVLLTYDDNDRFDLRGRPTSLAVFEAELAEALRRDTPGITLTWNNYRPGSDRRVAEYKLN